MSKRAPRGRAVTMAAAATFLDVEEAVVQDLVSTGVLWRIRVRGEKLIPLSELGRFEKSRASRRWRWR